MVLSLSVRLLPFANVNVFVPVNVVRVSIVALNSKFVFVTFNPPAAVVPPLAQQQQEIADFRRREREF